MAATCCNEGYFYVNSSGYYYDNAGNYIAIINTLYSSPTYNEVISNCAQFANQGYATVVQSSIDCPCCPEGYVYRGSGYCCPENKPACTLKESLPTIPCLPCDCADIPQQECQTCGTDGVHISYNFDYSKRQCTNCEVIDEATPGGCIATFIATPILSPITSNFRLRNKNFI